ncbi:MAG: hypothetical protein ABEJ77_05375 [Halanaeroarchaeum sp.]
MTSTEDRIAALADAAAALADAEAAVAEVGEERLERLEAARDDLLALLDRYEDRATGSGDFQAYLEFQEAVAELVEDLPADLPRREVFEDVDDRFQKRRLSADDFAAAREALEPVDDLVGRLREREGARESYRRARKRVTERRDELADEIDRLERVADLADADLDAPVEDLRDPIESYNAAVTGAFRDFVDGSPAREVLSFVAATQSFPLVAYPEPPADLREFLADAAAGTESIPTLLEYADYSRSKLEHYVDQPRTFMRLVGGNRTYLSRLDADPLTLEWPPAPAAEVRYRTDELVSVLDRFAPEDVIERLDAVRELARDEPHFEHLRAAARASAELTEEERARVADGSVASDLADRREERDRLDAALAEH